MGIGFGKRLFLEYAGTYVLLMERQLYVICVWIDCVLSRETFVLITHFAMFEERRSRITGTEASNGHSRHWTPRSLPSIPFTRNFTLLPSPVSYDRASHVGGTRAPHAPFTWLGNLVQPHLFMGLSVLFHVLHSTTKSGKTPQDVGQSLCLYCTGRWIVEEDTSKTPHGHFRLIAN